jgi:hypothetical protein
VTLVENTDDYVQVIVSVDDGSFWAACHPLTTGFLVTSKLHLLPRIHAEVGAVGVVEDDPGAGRFRS